MKRNEATQNNIYLSLLPILSHFSTFLIEIFIRHFLPL